MSTEVRGAFYRAVDSCIKDAPFESVSGPFNLYRGSQFNRNGPSYRSQGPVAGLVVMMRGRTAINHKSAGHSRLVVRRGRNMQYLAFFPRQDLPSLMNPREISAFAHVVLLDESKPPKILVTCMQKALVETPSKRLGRIVRSDPNQNQGPNRHLEFVDFAREIADEMARHGIPIDVLVPHPHAIQQLDTTRETRRRIQAPLRDFSETHETEHVAFGDYSLKCVNLSRPLGLGKFG